MNKYNSEYDDIIDLPHHTSATRKRMAVIDRAAQFAPFAALTGHDDAIKETARLTEKQTELTEDEKAILNGKLQMLLDVADPPEVTVTYFKPDDKKSGGEYIHITGVIKRFDEYKRAVIMADKNEIPIEMLYGIDCEIFNSYSFSMWYFVYS